MASLFADPLPVASDAPPFLLPGEDGSAFILNLNRNKYVILVFYPGDDTPTCTRQLCELRDRWEEISRRGGYVVGINPWGAGSHARFRNKHKLPFPLLVDNGKRVAKLYNAGGIIVKRTVYVIGKDGKILYARRGKPAVDEILSVIPEASASGAG